MSASTGVNIRPAPPAPLKSLLANYTTSHPLRSPSPLPPSSRVDPRLTQRSAPPTGSSPLLWTIPTWIAFARFALAKGLHIIWSLLSHFLFGPKRKSWGYRMTFITSFMRNVADHSSLADIVLVRRLISFHQIIPLPADAVVTPITFTVPLQTGQKIARGFLRDLDLSETGARQLSGEWVVGMEVWRRLKRERRERLDAERRRKKKKSSGLSGASANVNPAGLTRQPVGVGSNALLEEIGGVQGPRRSGSPDAYSDAEGSIASSARRANPDRERVIYYVHGGAYYVGNAATHRLVTIGVSKACNARVFAITYRLAPEHAFPLPLHDVLHGYLRLLAAPLSIPPENIVVMGDSAGGGLSLALCMYLRDEGYKMPSGLVLMSPWVDLTMSCGSWDDCADTDVVPRPEADDHLNPVGCYLGPQGISKHVTHPYASPLFGDLSGLPPMLIQSGDSEVLRDEITLLAHKATLAGTPVTHELYEDMVHVFQMFTWLPAAKAAIASIGRWCRVTLPIIEQDEADRSASMAQVNAYRSGMHQEVDAGAVDAQDPRIVDAGGVEVPAGDGASSQMDGGDEGRSTPVQRRRRGDSQRSGGLRLNLDAESLRARSDLPDVDTDSLPDDQVRSEHSSRSATPTPTGSTARSPAEQPGLSASASSVFDHVRMNESDDADFFSSPIRASSSAVDHAQRYSSYNGMPPPPVPPPQPPRFRRAVTSYSHSSWSRNATPHGSPPAGQSQSGLARRRRPTVGTPHMSPATSSRASAVGGPSNPVSPTPSVRRRLRASTISQQVPPTTRNRSESHSDISWLVEGYNEEGAANETVVYAPGGEVRSVGVLGLDEDGDGDDGF